MSTGSPVFTLRRIAAVSLIGFWLTGCMSKDAPEQAPAPAPISSVSSGSGQSAGGAGTPPPVTAQNPGGTGVSTVPAQPNIQNVPPQPGSAQKINSPAAAPSQGANATGQPVQTKDGRIVYNRTYNSIPKGSYNDDTYTVKRGDTLFYVAWITGNDFRDLAQRNNIQEPYSLSVGQTLKIGDSEGRPITGENAITVADARQQGVPVNSAQINSGAVAQKSVITYSGNSGKQNEGKMLPSSGKNVAMTTSPVADPSKSSAQSTTPPGKWRWPVEGKIIDNFSAAEGGNKGVDIAGSRGQPITATAAGRVVYAGNALRGYGNLVIIKHNDDYLSAYAHNDTMLVREQQAVQAGQKIATMGSTGTSSVRLHFEIRYKGKSVNPLRYLPQR